MSILIFVVPRSEQHTSDLTLAPAFHVLRTIDAAISSVSVIGIEGLREAAREVLKSLRRVHRTNVPPATVEYHHTMYSNMALAEIRALLSHARVHDGVTDGMYVFVVDEDIAATLEQEGEIELLPPCPTGYVAYRMAEQPIASGDRAHASSTAAPRTVAVVA